ncbi:MAG: alpha,alpha-trehalose-phosphate synthase (UDP-forming) [Pseudomonadota bacterium]
MSRLVVVSNRVAPVRRQKSSGGEGGLAVAVLESLRDKEGLWFGWSGQLSDRPNEGPEMCGAGSLTYAMVDLTQQDFDEYYNGFANRMLWPLFHYRLDLTDYSRRSMAGYNRVNQLFADNLTPLLRADDMIWVHDYHLIPMAEQLRQRGCHQRIGFFLHIPWPSPQVLLALPNHQQLVKALCAYDLVGFQTEEDLHSFCEYIEREADGHVMSNGMVKAFGRSFQVGAFPISIDAESVAGFAAEASQSHQNKRLLRSLGGRTLMIGVDRLDYSKGVSERFAAYEYLLQAYPATRGKVVLLQISPKSRVDVPEYVEMSRQLEAMTGHINSRYAEFDWNPIRYLNKGFNRRVLSGFFRTSRVGLVTPLRDGMNLVAKEYVAAQDPNDPGVLVLSRFAGAAHELKDAILVNPYDVESCGEAYQAALTMPLDERKDRWQRMNAQIQRNDISSWRRAFMEALTAYRKAA